MGLIARAWRCEHCGRLWPEQPGSQHDHANGRENCLGPVARVEVVRPGTAEGAVEALEFIRDHEPTNDEGAAAFEQFAHDVKARARSIVGGQ